MTHITLINSFLLIWAAWEHFSLVLKNYLIKSCSWNFCWICWIKKKLWQVSSCLGTAVEKDSSFKTLFWLIDSDFCDSFTSSKGFWVSAQHFFMNVKKRKMQINKCSLWSHQCCHCTGVPITGKHDNTSLNGMKLPLEITLLSERCRLTAQHLITATTGLLFDLSSGDWNK